MHVKHFESFDETPIDDRMHYLWHTGPTERALQSHSIDAIDFYIPYTCQICVKENVFSAAGQTTADCWPHDKEESPHCWCT